MNGSVKTLFLCVNFGILMICGAAAMNEADNERILPCTTPSAPYIHIANIFQCFGGCDMPNPAYSKTIQMSGTNFSVSVSASEEMGGIATSLILDWGSEQQELIEQFAAGGAALNNTPSFLRYKQPPDYDWEVSLTNQGCGNSRGHWGVIWPLVKRSWGPNCQVLYTGSRTDLPIPFGQYPTYFPNFYDIRIWGGWDGIRHHSNPCGVGNPPPPFPNAYYTGWHGNILQQLNTVAAGTGTGVLLTNRYIIKNGDIYDHICDHWNRISNDQAFYTNQEGTAQAQDSFVYIHYNDDQYDVIQPAWGDESLIDRQYGPDEHSSGSFHAINLSDPKNPGDFELDWQMSLSHIINDGHPVDFNVGLTSETSCTGNPMFPGISVSFSGVTTDFADARIRVLYDDGTFDQSTQSIKIKTGKNYCMTLKRINTRISLLVSEEPCSLLSFTITHDQSRNKTLSDFGNIAVYNCEQECRESEMYLNVWGLELYNHEDGQRVKTLIAPYNWNRYETEGNYMIIHDVITCALNCSSGGLKEGTCFYEFSSDLEINQFIPSDFGYYLCHSLIQNTDYVAYMIKRSGRWLGFVMVNAVDTPSDDWCLRLGREVPAGGLYSFGCGQGVSALSLSSLTTYCNTDDAPDCLFSLGDEIMFMTKYYFGSPRILRDLGFQMKGAPCWIPQ